MVTIQQQKQYFGVATERESNVSHYKYSMWISLDPRICLSNVVKDLQKILRRKNKPFFI